MFRGFMSANKLKFHKPFLISVALNGTQISFIISQSYLIIIIQNA